MQCGERRRKVSQKMAAKCERKSHLGVGQCVEPAKLIEDKTRQIDDPRAVGSRALAEGDAVETKKQRKGFGCISLGHETGNVEWKTRAFEQLHTVPRARIPTAFAARGCAKHTAVLPS